MALFKKRRPWLEKLAIAAGCPFIAVAIVCYVLWLYAGNPVLRVRENEQEAMGPTLKEGYIVLGFTWAYLFWPPEPGDVIICEPVFENDGDVDSFRIVPCVHPGWKENMHPQVPCYKDVFEKDPDQAFVCGTYDAFDLRRLAPSLPIPLSVVKAKAVRITHPPSAAGPIPPMPPMPEDGQP